MYTAKKYCEVQGAKHGPGSPGALLLGPPLTWGAFRTAADQKAYFSQKTKKRRTALYSTLHFIPLFRCPCQSYRFTTKYSVWISAPLYSLRTRAACTHSSKDTHRPSESYRFGLCSRPHRPFCCLLWQTPKLVGCFWGLFISVPKYYRPVVALFLGFFRIIAAFEILCCKVVALKKVQGRQVPQS